MLLLRALGGLSLESTPPFTQPKPLMLLSYLSIEGSQPRKHLAELFWPEGNRMKSLSMALTRLRQGVGDVVETDEKIARSTLASDAKTLLACLDKSAWQEASNLYTGAFLEGVLLEDWSSELEEWVYSTREYLAERVQYALLNLAEAAAVQQDFDQARRLAERAYKLPGLSGTEITHLKRLYPLLSASSSLFAPEVRKELDSYGIAMQLDRDKARSLFQQTTANPPLPMRRTSFVGRKVELSELASLITRTRLLTLLGTPGVGKTRLALQLANELQQANAFEAIYFVPLESLASGEQLVPAIVEILNLPQQPTTKPLKQLQEAIAEQTTLLVMDNFEQCIDSAHSLSELLQHCPNLNMLVTSRERLNLEEENLYHLEGLPFPGSQISVDQALQFDAVTLFSQRAQQLQPQFALKDQLEAVLNICKLLEGLPLGLELAAGWVRLMSCQEIASEIERSLEFLATTTRNVPERHRSLKAAFEYSWQGLTPKEQNVLGKLSVFSGGFRREAASEVAGATIPVLASLIDKSLLRFLPNGRYDQHPLLYQFGHEKLQATPEEHMHAATRHAHYYADLLREQGKLLKGPEEKDAIYVLAQELKNLEATWQHLVLTGDTQSLLTRMLPLSELCASLGKYKEGLVLFEGAISSFDATNKAHGLLLGHLYIAKARFLYFLARFEEAIVAGEEGLRLVSASDPSDTHARVRGLNEVSRSLISLRQDRKAAVYLEQAIQLLKDSGDYHRMATLQGNLAIQLSSQGDYEKAQVLAREACSVYEQVEDWEGAIWTLSIQAGIQRFQQHYQEQKALLEKALSLYEKKQVISSWLLCELHSSLGTVNRYLKAYTLAIDHLKQSLEIAKESNFLFKQPTILVSLGFNTLGLGDLQQAKIYFSQSLSMLKDSKEQVVLFYALTGWAETEVALGNCPPAAQVLGFVQKQSTLDEEDQRELAEALNALQAILDPGNLETYLDQGKTMTLEHIFALVLEDEKRTR